MQSFWERQGCVVVQPYHTEVGAGTFNPATFLRCLDARPWRAAYVEPSTRPADGRYGENPYRLGHYYQYQVVIKPSPADIQDVYLRSLEALGIDLAEHDVRFVEDNWEGPTLGAWGQGWEVWVDGMEITQFTYFQQLGGFDLDPITIEITYGLERLAMYLQGVDSVYDIVWSRWDGARRRASTSSPTATSTRRTSASSAATTSRSPTPTCCTATSASTRPRRSAAIEARLPIPAYDYVLKCSHAFNMLDARGVISVTDRTAHIARVRDLARKVAGLYLEVVGDGREDSATATGTTATARHPSSRGDRMTAGWLFEIGARSCPTRSVESLHRASSRGHAGAPGLVSALGCRAPARRRRAASGRLAERASR